MSTDELPNILYVFTDQQSARMMSCAGNPYLHTPAMDSLADRGIRFTRAATAYPLCTPARASMFTGRLPHEVGVEKNNVGIDEAFREVELGHLLSRAGYECVYGGKWHVPEISIPDTHGFRQICHFDDRILADACGEFFRQRDTSKPFFCVASFDNPHNVCEWPREQVLPWASIGDPPRVDDCPPLPANHAIAPYEANAIHLHRREYTRNGLVQNFDRDDWRKLKWAYCRITEAVDREIGKLLAHLEQAGLAENTIVIFSSDHGDLDGAHMLSHKVAPYEEAMNVPLIMAGPGVRPGVVDDHLTNSCTDFFATVCDYAGVALPDGCRGRSLRPLAETGQVEEWHEYVACETVMTDNADRPRGRIIYAGDYKYMAFEKGLNREQLFNLAEDPGEMVNLARQSSYRTIVEAFRERLREVCQQTADRFAGGHYAHPEDSFVIPGDSYV